MTFKCPKCGGHRLQGSFMFGEPMELYCLDCAIASRVPLQELSQPAQHAREPADVGGAVVFWMTTNINGDRRTPRRIFEHRSDAYHSAATERLDTDSVVPVVPKSALDAANAEAAAM